MRARSIDGWNTTAWLDVFPHTCRTVRYFANTACHASVLPRPEKRIARNTYVHLRDATSHQLSV